MAQIGGEPDKPPKRLAWFVDLFPESRERSRVARIPELQNGGTRLARSRQPMRTTRQLKPLGRATTAITA